MLYIGNALEELRKIPDESIDCVITSPPYYLLRDYGGENVECVWGGDQDCEHKWGERHVKQVRGDFSKAMVGNNRKGLDPQLKEYGRFCLKCGAWKGQLGHEPSPDMFVSHLADVFDEIYRVLKKTGNCFINIGDTYAGGGGTTGGCTQSWEEDASHRPSNRLSQKIVGKEKWIKRKQLLLVPYRLAIELQMRGWIIRDLIVWAKKVALVGKDGKVKRQIGNGTPESCKDRLTKSYEVIIHAVKSEKYFFSKPTTHLKPQSIERLLRGVSSDHKYARKYGGGNGLNRPRLNARKCKESLGERTTESTPLKPELPHKACKGAYVGNVLQINTNSFSGAHFAVMPIRLVRFLMEAGCPKNGVVLDPFMGSGTVAVVAEETNRRWKGIEINAEYAKLLKERLKGVQKKLFV